MIVAFTGHRPNKLGGYTWPNPTSLRVCSELRDALDTLKPNSAISGMAQGVDQWAATICVNMEIPFTAAVPFEGQEMVWPEMARKRWRFLIGRAAKVVVVSGGGYAVAKMQIRNRWMVDNSDLLIAVWDGTAGGTANCIRYAERNHKQIVRINPYP